jgi:hypothetical protein
MFENAIVIESPIEFAIVGPSDSRDKVLVKSKGAGLDLIGLAAEAWSSNELPRPPDPILSLWERRQLNVVKSFPARDVSSNSDTRSSRFSFAWIGLASRDGIQLIEKSLNLYLPDLHKAMRERDEAGIEWAIAPVIYTCTMANQRRRRIRSMLLAAAALYILLVAITGLAALLVALLNSLEVAKNLH